jgi:hypothetical protein
MLATARSSPRRPTSRKSTVSTNVRLVSFFPPPASDVVPVDIVACDHGIILDNVSSQLALSRPRSDTKRSLDTPRISCQHPPCWHPPHCECIDIYNVTLCEQRLCRLSWMQVIQAFRYFTRPLPLLLPLFPTTPAHTMYVLALHYPIPPSHVSP